MFKDTELKKILNPVILENIVSDKKNSFYIKKESLNGLEIWTINYRISNLEQWLENSLYREFRGLTYIPETEQYFLSIHKFFNHKENDLTQNIGNNLEITEKIDGSLIIPMIINDEVYFRTKGTIYSDQSKEVNKIFKNKTNYINLIKDLYKNNLIPLFEFTSPKFKIVVPYNTDLKLIQIRNLNNGKYLPYEEILKISKEYNISIPKKWNITYNDLLNLQNKLKNEEGFVVKDLTRNDYDMFQKFKTIWYLEQHRIKEEIYREDIIIKHILDEDIDDILSQVDDKEAKIFVNKIINKFTYKYNQLLEIINKLKQEYNKLGRKEYFKKYGKKYPFSYVVLSKDMENELKKWIYNNTKKLQKARNFLETNY